MLFGFGTPETNQEPVPTPPKKAMKISQTAVGRFAGKIRETFMGDAVRFTPVSLEEAFKIPPPPPGVVPKNVKMAMDSDFSPAMTYAAQSIYAEGLMFMGYSYLAQLSQRVEYRRVANILAEEMTRKWIKIQCTGDKKAKADKIQKIDAEFTRLKVKERCRQALEHDSIFGKGQIFVDFDNGKPNELKI